MNIKNKIKKTIKTVVLLFKTEKMIPIPKITDPNTLLDNKVALVTGGSSGIGFAIAKGIINSGGKVIIAGRNENKLKKCCEKMKNDINKIKYIVLDVTDVNTLDKKVNLAAKLFEENRIDILVNSAGVTSRPDFLKITEEEYDYIMDINTKGTFFMCKAVSKFMIENNIKGHILNVTSSSALRPAWGPYQMSKWAVRGFTVGLADTLLKHGIIVNAIAPGPVATPMLGKNEGDDIYLQNQPSGRYAMPDEIASLAVFMVSDMANLVVGDTFYITGGSGIISLDN